MNNLFSTDRRMLVYGLNKSYADIFCFSTTRHGGYSGGKYSSFNCNHYCGDRQEDVERNRKLLTDIISCEVSDLVIPHQVHGTEIRIVDESFFTLTNTGRREQLEGIDAVITNVPGKCLCVSTADCIPVMCYDVRNKAVAAIHAGWRGTVKRIVRKTLRQMQQSYGTRPEDIVAVIGPGISLQSFEVGDEVYQSFQEAGFDMESIAERYSKWHIDLWKANRKELESAGVKSCNIEVSGICTYINNDDFFSARRLGINSGRIISGIMIKNKNV